MMEMQQHGVFAPHGVEQCSDLVGECSLMVAAVPVDRFAAKWMPPDALRPAVSTSVIATPPHRLMTEVVLVYPPAALPSNVFWFEYRLSAVSRLVSRKFLLQPDRTARIGHATDIFGHQITRHEAFQGNAVIAGTKFGPSIVSVSTIVERYDNMQGDLRKLQAQREAHTSIGNGPGPGGVLHRTIGGVAEEIEIEAGVRGMGPKVRRASGAGRPLKRARIEAPVVLHRDVPMRSVKAEMTPQALDFGFHVDGAEPLPQPAAAADADCTRKQKLQLI